ncbi:MAG: HlyC/CorC family transporter [Candidatus Margulisbacteria bacterium]|nr:HlyC/CorC family transporter [Candidatus Margulisiibacteriota bacterium]
MELHIIITFSTFVIFLLLSAFFSSAETAFTGVNKFKIRHLVDQKVKGALTVQNILKSPRNLITGILIGNNIANIGASALATKVSLDFFAYIGVTNLAVTMAMITGAMTFILLVFGEITPKTFAIKNPEKLVLLYAKPISLFLVITHPLILMFVSITKGLSHLLGISTTETKKLVTTEEIKTILEVGGEEGLLEEEEKAMIHSIFEFSETVVREIMTPRIDVVCIESDKTIIDVIQLIQEKGHSRIPVYEDRIDNIVGVIYAKDLLSSNNPSEVSVKKFMRKPIFIPETKSIEAVLHQMKKEKFHMAMVIDEYGGMSGIVTMEDIIEEIIGEIQDEYDRENPEFIKIGDHLFLVDAKISVNDLSDKIGITFPENEDYDTLAGFVISTLGRFPEEGEEIPLKNCIIRVKEVHKRRITKLEIVTFSSEDNENDTLEDTP